MRKVQNNIQLVLQTYHISSFQSYSIHRGRLIEEFSLKHHVLVPMFTCNLRYDFIPVNLIHFFQFLDLSQLFLNLHKLLSCFRLHCWYFLFERIYFFPVKNWSDPNYDKDSYNHNKESDPYIRLILGGTVSDNNRLNGSFIGCKAETIILQIGILMLMMIGRNFNIFWIIRDSLKGPEDANTLLNRLLRLMRFFVGFDLIRVNKACVCFVKFKSIWFDQVSVLLMLILLRNILKGKLLFLVVV